MVFCHRYCGVIEEYRMKDREQKTTDSLPVRLYKGLHYSVSVILFSFFWLKFRYGSFSDIVITKAFRYDLYIVVFFAVLLYLFSRIYNAYLLGYTRIRQLAFSQFISQIFSTVIILAAVTVAWMKFRSPAVFFIMFLLDAVMDCLWAYSASRLFYKLNPRKRAVIVFGGGSVECSRFDISGKPVERLITIEKEILCTEDNLPEVLTELRQYDVFFAVGISPDCLNTLTRYCVEEDAVGYFIPNVEEIIFQNAYHIQSFHEPVLAVTRKKNKLEYLIVKRTFDIAASLLGIILLSPFMLITALAIKAYDGGPAIYRQKRLTVDNRVFTLYKFRSMRVDAEKDGKAVLSSGEKDSRITPIGKVIRSVRFDELPQLINILKGDMTIVGPRPERPEIAEEYYKTLPEFKLRLQVKAGLTGYAQVYGKYNTSPEQKLKFDLMYINSMSIFTDLKLMFATLGILFEKESTEGVEKEQQENRPGF